MDIVVELKWDKEVETAITQIKNQNYGKNLEGYSGELLLVGISYNKDDKNKKHSCIIESVTK